MNYLEMVHHNRVHCFYGGWQYRPIEHESKPGVGLAGCCIAKKSLIKKKLSIIIIMYMKNVLIVHLHLLMAIKAQLPSEAGLTGYNDKMGTAIIQLIKDSYQPLSNILCALRLSY